MFQHERKFQYLNANKKLSDPTGIGVIVQFVDQTMIDIVSMFLKQSLKLCGISFVVAHLNKHFAFIHTPSSIAGFYSS